MRGISFTALLISNLAYWAIWVLTIAIMVTAGFVLVLVGGNVDARHAADALQSSEAFDLFGQWVPHATAAVGSGFVAACLGRERPKLQGALALGSVVLLYVFHLGHGPALHDDADLDAPVISMFAMVYQSAGLLLGMLGGHLAQRHQVRLAAMSPQERDARTLKATAVSVLRWTLAFPAAIAAFAIAAALAHVLIPYVPYDFVFGIVIAILAGTWLAPPAHRTFAGFLFIGLALLVPAEEAARHVWFGQSAAASTMAIFYDTIGAGFAYVGLRKAFPRSFATPPGRWWWLLDLDLNRWSAEERTARRGLAAALGVIWIALFLLAWALLDGQGLDLALAGVVILPIGVMAARPAFAWMAPDLLRRADQNAAARLERHDATPAE